MRGNLFPVNYGGRDCAPGSWKEESREAAPRCSEEIEQLLGRLAEERE